MKNKPKPFAGILNDCITRRVVNSEELHKMNLFKDITIGGFSCFGEFMGIPLNDTLTSVNIMIISLFITRNLKGTFY